MDGEVSAAIVSSAWMVRCDLLCCDNGNKKCVILVYGELFLRVQQRQQDNSSAASFELYVCMCECAQAIIFGHGF